MALPIRPRASTGVIRALVDRVVPAYEAHLNERGCGPSAFSALTRTARHMLAWLTLCEADVAALDIRGVASFLGHACDCPADFRSNLNESSRWLAHAVLGYLIETGQTAVPAEIETGGRLVDEFAGSLTAQGYRASTMRTYQPCCRHFMVWLYLMGLELADIDGSVLRRFLDHDCACAHPQFLSRPRPFSGTRYTAAKLEAFADFLVDRDVVVDWREPLPKAHRSAHVEAFLAWLRQQRGVRETTLGNYSYALRAVLPLLGEHSASYDAASIRAALLDRAQSGKRGQAAHEATALRSYLRFLAVHGLCRPGLVGAVPTISRRPVAQLPRYVAEADVEALIASCAPATPVGLRDRAVLLLLARLALRPGDIAALRLDAIDWQQAVLTLCGKSRRTAALPLPQEVGDALKDYILRARPRTPDATVFQRALAPHAGLTSQAIGSIVKRAMKRAGIAGDGLPAASLFRHSRATHLLRGGASLETVGALLRHQSVQTTAIYARVDVPMLLSVAQPWPGEPR